MTRRTKVVKAAPRAAVDLNSLRGELHRFHARLELLSALCPEGRQIVAGAARSELMQLGRKLEDVFLQAWCLSNSESEDARSFRKQFDSQQVEVRTAIAHVLTFFQRIYRTGECQVL